MVNNNIHTDKEIDKEITNNHSLINSISAEIGVPVEIVEKQYKLHILQYSRCNINHEELRDIVIKRLSNYKSNFDFFSKKALIEKIQPNSKIKNGYIYNVNNFVKITFKQVPDDIGKFIESNLHYLFSFREDALFRFGLFIDNAEYPFCYMSFSTITRYYRLYSVNTFTNQQIKYNELLNLTRVYGFGRLPKNTISSIISLCCEKLKSEKYKYITTSVNPYLGFTGKSMLASEFIPIANCPVSYNYFNGLYLTRRNLKDLAYLPQKTTAPPNILLLKKLNCSKGKKLIKKETIMNIDDKLYNKENVNLDISINKEKTVNEVRNDLEKVWSKITRYHRTNFDDSADPKSKGQCGVTTAYLAKELSDGGFNTLFCEGNVHFPDNTESIENHCWIRITEYRIEHNTIKNLIIDLTSDQTGFNESVICSPVENLESRGIVYEEVKAYTPDEIKNNSLSKRLDKLEKLLKKLK